MTLHRDLQEEIEQIRLIEFLMRLNWKIDEDTEGFRCMSYIDEQGTEYTLTNGSENDIPTSLDDTDTCLCIEPDGGRAEGFIAGDVHSIMLEHVAEVA
jgi:hypothetical protein